MVDKVYISYTWQTDRRLCIDPFSSALLGKKKSHTAHRVSDAELFVRCPACQNGHSAVAEIGALDMMHTGQILRKKYWFT